MTTTRVDLMRAPQGDTDQPATYNAFAQNRRAVVHSQAGQERVLGGQQEDVLGRVDLDPGEDIRHYDRVYDRGTGHTWEVVWVRLRQGFGLDHIEAGVRWVSGAARG